MVDKSSIIFFLFNYFCYLPTVFPRFKISKFLSSASIFLLSLLSLVFTAYCSPQNYIFSNESFLSHYRIASETYYCGKRKFYRRIGERGGKRRKGERIGGWIWGRHRNGLFHLFLAFISRPEFILLPVFFFSFFLTNLTQFFPFFISDSLLNYDSRSHC